MPENVAEIILDAEKEENWPKLYKQDGLQQFINSLEKDILDMTKEVPDVTTEKGRERIGSLARKVSSSKTAIEKPGRDYLKKLKAKIKPAEAEIKRYVDWCNSKRDEILAPRNEWEQQQEARKAAHQAKMDILQGYFDLDLNGESSEDLTGLLKELEDLEPDESFEEFTAPAIKTWKDAKAKIQTALDARLKYEAEQAELERLRAEKEERDRKQREAKIAQEAAERARIEAETKAKEEAEAAERKAQEERELAAKREADAKAAQEAAEQAKVAAEEKAKQDAIEAEERQKAAVLAAEQRAKDQAEKAKRDEEAAAKRREANKQHHAKINNEAVAALIANCPSCDEVLAKEIVTAIAKGFINNVSIRY